MGRPKPKHVFEPRMMSAFDVACRLNRSEQWFYANLRRLEDEGFPRPDSLLGLYDARAIELWLDRRSGLESAPPKATRDAPPAGPIDPIMQAINGPH